MPFNGSGGFSAPSVSGWPASPGAIISSTAVNTVINDIMAGLSAVLPRDGQSAMTGPLNMGAQKITNVLFSEEAAAPNVASAATVDVGAQPGRTFAITGTTTVTSFGVANSGVWKFIRFTDATPLTYSSNLRLPGSASLVTRSGDALLALSLGSGVWEVLAYFNRYDAGGNLCKFSAIEIPSAITVNTTQTIVSFSTELFDTANAFAGNTFTAPSTGSYLFQFSGTLSFETGSTEGSVRFGFVYNSNAWATSGYISRYNPYAVRSFYQPISTQVILNLAAGSTLRVGIQKAVEVTDTVYLLDNRMFTGTLLV